MKEKRGFISMKILMMASTLFIIVLYLVHTTLLEDLVLTSTANNIQSYYLSEAKTLMTIHDEKYYEDQLYPILLDAFRNHRFPTSDNSSIRVIIDSGDLNSDDSINNVKVSFIDRNKRKEIILDAQSNYRGLKSQVFSSGPVVNHLFEIGESNLDLGTISNEEQEELNILLEKISNNIAIDYSNLPNNLYAIEYKNYNNIAIHKVDRTNYEILCYRDNMDRPYIEGFDKKNIFLICKNIEGEALSLSLGKSDELHEDINLSGVLYVEGNLKISCNFVFNGIIVVKNGEIQIDSPNKPKINGLLITENVDNISELINSIDLEYNSRYVYIYGTFLPGFLEPKINLIKSK